jgi:hypothetical protein
LPVPPVWPSRRVGRFVPRSLGCGAAQYPLEAFQPLRCQASDLAQEAGIGSVRQQGLMSAHVLTIVGVRNLDVPLDRGSNEKQRDGRPEPGRRFLHERPGHHPRKL